MPQIYEGEAQPHKSGKPDRKGTAFPHIGGHSPKTIFVIAINFYGKTYEKLLRKNTTAFCSDLGNAVHF
jgi:hypothetical protein